MKCYGRVNLGSVAEGSRGSTAVGIGRDSAVSLGSTAILGSIAEFEAVREEEESASEPERGGSVAIKVERKFVGGGDGDMGGFEWMDGGGI